MTEATFESPQHYSSRQTSREMSKSASRSIFKTRKALEVFGADIPEGLPLRFDHWNVRKTQIIEDRTVFCCQSKLLNAEKHYRRHQKRFEKFMGYLLAE